MEKRKAKRTGRLKETKKGKVKLLQASRKKKGKEIQAGTGNNQKANGQDSDTSSSLAEGTKEEIEKAIRNLRWCAERIKNDLPPIYTMDFETDPFLRDRVPVPFAVGLFDGVVRRRFWSDSKTSCIDKMRNFLESGILEPGIIYMHNGGRFDFFFVLDWFEGKAMLINSRIVKAYMPIKAWSTSTKRNHRINEHSFEFRDSYAIMPFPLAAYDKLHIDINKLSRENREANRDEINLYLDRDCESLWELCIQFQQEFGNFCTIASAAFKQLTNIHKFEKLPEAQDEIFRKNFYFGGRVQCFEKGIIEDQPVNIYDVNSMYPFAMQNYEHPVGWCSVQDREIHDSKHLKTFFLTVQGKNHNAFPVREKDGSIKFDEKQGIFHVSIHEWNVGIELGCFEPSQIICTYNFVDYAKFHQFVDHFYKLREKAKTEGDKMHTLFYKFVLNSAYGKFALNPENYSDWQITREAETPKGEGWFLDSMVQGKYFIWKKPNGRKWNINNIATAASITGAARAILLRAIHQSRNVLYCDTDSLICEKLYGGELHDKKLGCWKLEATGDKAAIAGKKMYAVFSGAECVKMATKGVSLQPEEIISLCRGENVMSFRDAPTFQRDGSTKFISRKVRMT